jgi:hypothetical protein
MGAGGNVFTLSRLETTPNIKRRFKRRFVIEFYAGGLKFTVITVCTDTTLPFS